MLANHMNSYVLDHDDRQLYEFVWRVSIMTETLLITLGGFQVSVGKAQFLIKPAFKRLPKHSRVRMYTLRTKKCCPLMHFAVLDFSIGQ